MEILNNSLINFQSEVVSVKVVGHNLTTDALGLYTLDIPIHSPLSGFPLDRISGRSRTENMVMATDGSLGDITISDVEIPTQEGTLTISDNSLFRTGTVVAGYRDAIIGMILGESFFDGKGDKIKVLGVAGNVKNNRWRYNNDWKYFFDLDNKLILPYSETEDINKFMNATSKHSICVAMEVKGTYNDFSARVLKYGAVFFSGSGISEANESNTIDTPVKFRSDFREYTGNMEEGFAIAEVDATDSTAIKRFNVSAILVNATGASPTDFGTSGTLVAVIDSSTGAVSVQESNGTDTWTPVTGTFVAGALIFSTKTGTVKLADAVDGYTYVAIKTGGVAGGTAVATTVTNTTTYTLGTTYTLPIYKFSFSTKAFERVESDDDL